MLPASGMTGYSFSDGDSMKRPDFIKTIHELSLNDLKRHPIWLNAYNTDIEEPWYDEAPADEVTYRPWFGKPPFDCSTPTARAPLAAADFVLQDSTMLAGCCHLPNANVADRELAFRYTQPLMFIGGTTFGFWLGAAAEAVARTELERLIHLLARPIDLIFPIHYKISDGLVIPGHAGKINGLGRLSPVDYKTVVIEC